MREVLLRVVELLDVAADVLPRTIFSSGTVSGHTESKCEILVICSALYFNQSQCPKPMGGHVSHNGAVNSVWSFRAPDVGNTCTRRSLWSALRRISPIFPNSSSMEDFALARSSLQATPGKSCMMQSQAPNKTCIASCPCNTVETLCGQFA